jgi:hypothetical protein
MKLRKNLIGTLVKRFDNGVTEVVDIVGVIVGPAFKRECPIFCV